MPRCRMRNSSLSSPAALQVIFDLVMEGEQYGLRARLNISLPGLDRELAEQPVAAAHQTCPYSKATRGNIPVEINVV